MSKQFEDFFSQLKETNDTLNSFTDFEKVENNVTKISIKLNQLNYLIGRTDLHAAVYNLYEENPKVFDVLNILIAIRSDMSKKIINKFGDVELLADYFTSPEKVIEFIEGTGLNKLFINKSISNLVDYVFGVEVGLDSNARKNRGGKRMSLEVSKIFSQEGIFFKKEVKSTFFKEIKTLGVDLKKFDFVIATKKKTYLIEANFYNGMGSKLNETARSYSDIGPKINQYDNYEFVWITDGIGWVNAKNKLHEAYTIIPCVYNLSTIQHFVNRLKTEGVVEIQ